MLRRTLRKLRAPRRPASLHRARRRYRLRCLVNFVWFLLRGKQLRFSNTDPQISVVIVLYRKADLSLACFQSLQAQGMDLDVILVNNGIDWGTARLLRQVEGITLVENPDNVGFLKAANEGADLAETDYILFLNNDTRLKPHCLTRALESLRGNLRIGAVGGKVVGLDGLVLEAGGSIWQDGSTRCEGRGLGAGAPAVNHQRTVDYVSGCFLLTPTRVFQELGGLDDRFAPAYYEDTDYCLRLWQSGYQVLYDPRVELDHVENGSSPNNKLPQWRIEHNKEIFFQRHERSLASHPFPLSPEKRVLPCTRQSRNRILYLEDRVPHLHQGSGYARSNRIIAALTELGWPVILYPLTYTKQERDLSDLPPQVRIEWNRGLEGLVDFLNHYRTEFGAIWVSRPHNLSLVLRALRKARVPRGLHPLLFDSEAVVADRNFLLQPETLLMGRPALDAAREAEISLARQADRVIAVNEKDRQTFLKGGVEEVTVVGHGVRNEPTPACFEQRGGILFLGEFGEDPSPNSLALEHFVHRILPDLRNQLSLELHVVGAMDNSRAEALRHEPGVRFWGSQPDLRGAMDKVRFLVAPHSVGAGMPLKVVLAAAHGVPSIVSPLLAEQLGWEAGLLVANPANRSFRDACQQLYENASLWRQLREQALAEVERRYHPDRLREQVRSALVTSLPEERVPVVHGRFKSFRDRPEGRPT